MPVAMECVESGTFRVLIPRAEWVGQTHADKDGDINKYPHFLICMKWSWRISQYVDETRADTSVNRIKGQVIKFVLRLAHNKGDKQEAFMNRLRYVSPGLKQ